MELNVLQHLGLNLALKGHNFIITGQAGTGKTFLLQKIVGLLTSQGKSAGIVCSTGLACSNFPPKYRAKTLHSWSGFGDCRHPRDILLDRITKNDDYSATLQRYLSTQVLVIDEISMISSKLLADFEYVCRKVRGENLWFGGMQVILSGDFYQLCPVPNKITGDNGEHCFQWINFGSVFPHTLNLEAVVRQTEVDLIRAVNEISRGELSPATSQLLKDLSRPLRADSTPLKLMSRNIDVDVFNADRIEKFPGQPKIYKSHDTGSLHCLRKIRAPRNLVLKVNCPVILLVNLSDVLVNGLRGHVTALEDSGPVISFPSVNIIHRMMPYLFSEFDVTSKKVLAERKQFPLTLAFGITIHKSQGMTLDLVEVDAANIFVAGQLGVAVGRAKTKDGLRIVNFKRSAVIKPSQKVADFYTRPCEEPQDTLSCCHSHPEEHHEMGISYTDESEDSEFSENELNEIEAMISYTVQTSELPVTVWPENWDVPQIDINNLVKTLTLNDPIIEYQHKWNSVLQELLQNPDTPHFLSEQQIVVYNLLQHHCPGLLTTGKESEVSKWTSFYKHFHQYTTSHKYEEYTVNLFHRHSLVDVQKHVAAKLLTCVREDLLSHFSKRKVDEQAQKLSSKTVHIPTSQTMSAAGRGKVRYIGGRTVAKLRCKYMRKVHNNVNKLDRQSRELVRVAYTKINVLKDMTATEIELQASDDLASLEETAKRQNFRHGLTNITDRSHDFFMNMVNKVTELENFATLQLYGSELPSNVEQHIRDDKDLFHQFTSIFTSCSTIHENEAMPHAYHTADVDVFHCLQDISLTSECISLLYIEIISSFLNVYHNQLRKNYLAHIHREKKIAHRKQITKAKLHQTTKPALCDIYSDTSDGKHVSHLQLKACVLQNSECFLDRVYTKADLILLCKAYGSHFTNSDTKKVLNGRLVSAISNADGFTDVHVIQPSKSSDSSASGGKRKSAASKELTSTSPKPGTSTQTGNEDETHCKVCRKIEHESEEWIGCDQCDGWFHRLCAGLEDDTEWNTLNSTEMNWYCKNCSKKQRK